MKKMRKNVAVVEFWQIEREDASINIKNLSDLSPLELREIENGYCIDLRGAKKIYSQNKFDYFLLIYPRSILPATGIQVGVRKKDGR